jgi:hypothetical protein
MDMRLEHADSTASSAFSGRQAALYVGGAAFGNRMARTSASSSTRRGRIDTARHRKSLWAYSRFSSSMPSRVRPYVSSNVFGKSSNTLFILAGKVRHSLLAWQTTQRNLHYHVRINCEADMRCAYMPSDLSDNVSTTSRLSSSFHLRMLRSERTTDSMYLIMSSFCPFSS